MNKPSPVDFLKSKDVSELMRRQLLLTTALIIMVSVGNLIVSLAGSLPLEAPQSRSIVGDLPKIFVESALKNKIDT